MESDSWLGIEVRHLAALHAVARERSFSRAAARLGYTQSAISQQIAALERIVGHRLLDRPNGRRDVQLTDVGELLLRHADAIVGRLHAAEADVAAMAAGEAGRLRVGTYQSVGARVLPEVVRRFVSAWPQVEVSLTESAEDDLLDPIERGELDLAFVMLPLPEGPFEAAELLEDPYVLVVPAGSELAERARPPSFREIGRLPLIGNLRNACQRRVESTLRARGVEPNLVFRSSDNGTVQALVAAGVGCALVPRLTVDESDPRTVALPLGSKVPPRTIAVVWHRDRFRSPAAVAFVEEARRVAEEVSARPGSAGRESRAVSAR